jgi:glycosyltransferase involved in cell wall biosynthesis
MYDLIYITNIPSFYKINLFNRVAAQRKLLVIFTHDKSSHRNNDFYKGDRNFEFVSIADKSLPGKILFLYKLLHTTRYQQLIIGGWDQLVLWFAAFISPRKMNSLVVESSIFESSTSGYKGLIKRQFISRTSKAYVSGKSQAALAKALGFIGQLIVTKGVGIFNVRPQPAYKASLSVKNFIYVGRLSPEKNLQFLIETFNQIPELTLNIIGFGPQEIFLKSIAKSNINFHGAIPNSELFQYYQLNDVFILPSVSEPWGMVVEEAFNNGLPVIVSDKVGCAEEIVNESNGIIFRISEPDGLHKALQKIREIDYYNFLKMNVSNMDFERIAIEQVNCYL